MEAAARTHDRVPHGVQAMEDVRMLQDQRRGLTRRGWRGGVAVAAPTQQELTFEWAGLRLAGTLALPATPPPHPAVLMLQGSGPADRDADGYFLPIRDTFLSRGLATYAFDKPGCGASTGDWRDYALVGRAAQAEAALQLLREHAAIDATRLGVWGQSQGGWLVQILAAAAREPALAFAIANSGAAIDVPTQDLAGCEHTMRAAGSAEDDIARALDFIRAVHAAALRGDDFASVDEQLFAPARGQAWYGYLTVDSEQDWRGLGRFVTEPYDPAATLERIQCPLLAIFGAQDVLVPAWQSAHIYSAAQRAAHNPDVTITIFPQGNHRIQLSQGGPFVAGYLDLLGDWVARRVANR
jgi:pimeloyl-ACP methyl ester carboxylesterase